MLQFLTTNDDEENPASEEFSNSKDLADQIAELAYYKAQTRGFEAGHELDDWLEAEQQLML